MSLRRLVPIADRVLIRRIVPELKSAGGIILPETQQKKNEGEVVAVGPGALNRDGVRVPCTVAEGDVVLLPEYGGVTVKIGEEEFALFRDEDILGKFEDK